MATGVITWSETAATNASADGNINFAEGMAPSQVDDSCRAMMASVAKWRDDLNGTLVTSGSSSAFTVATNQVESALTSGYTVAVQFHVTTDTSATLNVDGLGAKPLQLLAGTNLSGKEYTGGSIQTFTYSSTGTGQWIAHGTVNVGAAPVFNVASLVNTDQTLSGGANVTSATLAAGNITVDCGKCPLQFISNSGAFTITAPANDGSCVILVTNQAGAGTITFSGFTVGSNTGDALDTTNGHHFMISILRINGLSTYFIKATQ